MTKSSSSSVYRYSIGIIGCGYVGKAVAAGFSLHVQSVLMYDKYDDQYDSIYNTVNHSDFLFVCVPTPTKEDGTQDLSELHDTLLKIDKLAIEPKRIIIKSTVLPGTTRIYSKAFDRHYFAFNPEFLSARTARLDFINPSRIIIGAQVPTARSIEKLYRFRFGDSVPIFTCTWEAAELVKYVANSFFAMKISFCNEIYDIAESMNIPYEAIKDMWLSDGKIANSHCNVPGHDRIRGFGGTCFPKDIKAFIKWAEDNNKKLDTIKATQQVNNRVRNARTS